MTLDLGRPSQKTQRSRKGKKAWRKNIDLDEFEQNLDNVRESEIALGPQQELFTVDREGTDEGLTSAMKSEKKLKSHEILNARSAFPALPVLHKKKDKPKHKVMKDRQKLLERAGFTDKSKIKAELERDGLLKIGKVAGLWDEAMPSSSITSPTNAIKPQIAQKRRKPDAPLPGTPAVELPHGGQSYNPALEEWKASIFAEHEKLEKEEIKRVQAGEQQARIDAVIAETQAKLENEQEVDSSDSEVDESEIGRLSVNPPAKLKRKTQAQRNKKLRHKQWLFETSQLLQKKHFMKKLAEEAEKRHVEPKTKPKRQKQLIRAHSAHPVAPQPLAVKLSDELEDSMRRLRPEGNLIMERMRNLQARGLVEARVAVKKPKSRSKMVEKYSHKHFQ